MVKTKRELSEDIERARRLFMASGRRAEKLAPAISDRINNAKPRKQRLKMFA